MSKIKAVSQFLSGEGSWLRKSGRALDTVADTVGKWFRKDPGNHAKLADAIPNLPVVYKNNPTRMVEWVKNNKINTAIIAYEVAGLADLAFELREENPEVFALLDTFNSDDTMETIKLSSKDRESREKSRSEARKKALDEVSRLSVAELQAFKDEAKLIEDIISGAAGIFPGVDRDTREQQLHMLRRVIMMPESNFMIHETLRGLGM